MSIESGDRNLSLNFSFRCIPPPICNTMQKSAAFIWLRKKPQQRRDTFNLDCSGAAEGSTGLRKVHTATAPGCARARVILFTRSEKPKHQKRQQLMGFSASEFV